MARRNESAFRAKDPDELVPFVIRIPRHVKELIARWCAETGQTQTQWAQSVLEQAAKRRFRVQCFHPARLVVNDWCLECETWIGWDDGGEQAAE